MLRELRSELSSGKTKELAKSLHRDTLTYCNVLIL